MGTPHYSGPMFYTYLDSDKAWEIIEQKIMGYDVSLDKLYPDHFLTEVTSIKNEKKIQSMIMPAEE